jgi:hypothetical protein
MIYEFLNVRGSTRKLTDQEFEAAKTKILGI